MKLTPRSQRIAFQIWWLIQETGGDCTVDDMVELTGAPKGTCAKICSIKGWQTLYRKMTAPKFEHPTLLHGTATS